MIKVAGKLGNIVAIVFTLALFCNVALAGQRRNRPAKPRVTRTPSTRTAPPATSASAVKLERLPPDPDVEKADIAITANIKAKSLILEAVPNPTVTFPGKPERNTVWEAKRENLPTPVQPGVTYRDIGIRLKITSVFTDIDRIVAEALGEIPVSDDSQSASVTPPTPAASEKVPPTANPPARPRSPQRNRR